LLLWTRYRYEKADYEDAASIATRAEKIFGQQSPPQMNGISAALNLRGLALSALGYLAEAEPLLRLALAIFEQSLGSDHPCVATVLSNLAQLLAGTNRLTEAEPLLRRALAIFEQSLGSDHPCVAAALIILARLLQDTSRLTEAEPLMRCAVGIHLKFTRQTGHPHPDMQTVVANYAGLLQEMGLNDAELRQRLNDLRGEYGMASE
jgi:tetratricopeptide (TPR) repeat protein